MISGSSDRVGRQSEALAALALRLKGWRIVARRFRTPVGEIDLVARRGRVTAFVEVKARRAAPGALAAVGEPQRVRRFERAAACWLARHPEDEGRILRFDAVLVLPWRWPLQVSDLWRAAH